MTNDQIETAVLTGIQANGVALAANGSTNGYVVATSTKKHLLKVYQSPLPFMIDLHAVTGGGGPHAPVPGQMAGDTVTWVLDTPTDTFTLSRVKK